MCDVRTICPKCEKAVMYTDSTVMVNGLIHHLICGTEEKTEPKPISRWEQECIRKLFSRSASHE